MKKVILILLFLVFTVKGFSDTFDFSAVCASGQMLYYRILNPQEVIVVEPRLPNHTAPWSGYDKPTGDLVIPETVEYEGNTYTVVSVGPNAFRECQELTSIQLPNTIRKIGAEAFDYCTGLTGAFVIPDQCTFIGAYALWECFYLTSLTIGAAVDTIQWSAFEDCTSLQVIHCNTPTLPFAEHIPSNPYYEDRSIFNNVPTDIPVYVNCLAIDQFQMSQDWSRFTNMEGVFVGAPSLTVEVNKPSFGIAEVLSVPVDCDDITATVRATPSPGHVFGYWKRNGAVVSHDPEYTFTLNHNTTLIACFDGIVTVYDTIGYPTHVIGRSMNTAGQVTAEHFSDFSYGGINGHLNAYSFPGVLHSSFGFYHYPDMPSIISMEYAEWPKETKGPGSYYERYSFNYENNQKKHIDFFAWTDYFEEPHYYWDYSYENHYLYKENFSSSDDDYITRYVYSYENNYKTRIDRYYKGYEDNLKISSETTNHYNERHQILTSQTDTYDNTGEITARNLKIYTYTDHNKTDSIITQTFNDGVWVNSGIAHYVYDLKNRIVEFQTGSWSTENSAWNITKKVTYDFNEDLQTLTVSFLKKSGDEWVWDKFSNQSLFNDARLYEWERVLGSAYGNKNIGQFEFSMYYEMEETSFPFLSEWYYQIKMENGDITYQHLEYASDTTINNDRTKVIVRTNQIYDKGGQTVVTHEYIKEENNKVYWWNKGLHEFTILYDYAAEEGDEWEIKVGTESILVHVDGVEAYEHDGETYNTLHISDAGDVFSGDIIVGIGHTTSFFPEKLMRASSDFKVDGLRCYLVQDALLYHDGDKECDAVSLYAVDEIETQGFVVYPNPTDGLLHVETSHGVSLPVEYRITNIMGQTLLSGTSPQIDVSTLPAGLYFITLGTQTLKFTKMK